MRTPNTLIHHSQLSFIGIIMELFSEAVLSHYGVDCTQLGMARLSLTGGWIASLSWICSAVRPIYTF